MGFGFVESASVGGGNLGETEEPSVTRSPSHEVSCMIITLYSVICGANAGSRPRSLARPSRTGSTGTSEPSAFPTTVANWGTVTTKKWRTKHCGRHLAGCWSVTSMLPTTTTLDCNNRAGPLCLRTPVALGLPIQGPEACPVVGGRPPSVGSREEPHTPRAAATPSGPTQT